MYLNKIVTVKREQMNLCLSFSKRKLGIAKEFNEKDMIMIPHILNIEMWPAFKSLKFNFKLIKLVIIAIYIID